MKVTFLGTGTSRGIPVIGCRCPVCRSDDPRNRRLRSSVLLQTESVSVVIDTSVDFRLQMLRHDVASIDAVVFTHAHADHILGLDDVYPFSARSRKPMPIYASTETLRQIRVTFRHLFAENPYPGIAEIEPHEIDGAFSIGDLRFEPIDVLHGSLPILGFRIGGFGYLTDVNCIPEDSRKKLGGLDCLVIDGLRYRSHPSHFSLEEASEASRQLKPRSTYLIHMSHDVEHEEGSRILPDGVALAYDGLVLEIP